MNAIAQFRRAIEPLADKLSALADSGLADQSTELAQVREAYFAAYVSHGCQFVSEILPTSADWRTAIDMARTMAKSEGTTPREWLVGRIAAQWSTTVEPVASSLRLLEKVIGRPGHAGANRRVRVRLRDLYDEQADRLANEEALAPADTTTRESAAEVEAKAAAPPVPTPAAEEPAPIVPDATTAGSKLAGSQKPARQLPDRTELDQRRASLRRFVDTYREAREYKLSYTEIAILAHHRNRSTIVKYLRGDASDQCVHNVQGVFKMSPEQVDEKCKERQRQLPRLWAHLVYIRAHSGAFGRS
jgi:hypothetical protein